MPALVGKLPAVERFLGREHQLLIGGKWLGAQSGKAFPVYNPATGEIIATVAEGDRADVDRAVTSSRAAFEHWNRVTPAQRAKILWRIADLIEHNAEELAQLDTLDNGKPLQHARAVDIPASCEILRYFAGWCDKLDGITTRTNMPDVHAYTLREPLGVCGQIVPWNFPLLNATVKIAPCLATGNVSILKPSEETPLSALRLGEICLEAGLPEGALNVVPGFGHTAGAALAAHPDVDKVAFTGSTEVGKSIVQAASGNLKKVSLELGGKSPNIVFADADLDKAVAGSANAIFFNSGQLCVAGSRLYAQNKVFDQVIEGIAAIAGRIKVGPGMSLDSEMGPLVSGVQFDRVTRMIQSGLEGGAKLAIGGKQIGTQGYFLEPTVLINTGAQMPVVREEIFGPVLVAQPIDDLSEVVRAANDTPYGLSASVWTRDLSRAHQMASALKAGIVWINMHGATDIHLPFGGYKQSGWGREFGRESLDMYTQVKAVVAKLL